jgi:organic radical activating enzyme
MVFEQFNSYKQAKKTLKRLFKIAEVGSVTFTGGEPFLAERFNELVLFTRLKNKSVTIITNGNAAAKTITSKWSNWVLIYLSYLFIHQVRRSMIL